MDASKNLVGPWPVSLKLVAHHPMYQEVANSVGGGRSMLALPSMFLSLPLPFFSLQKSMKIFGEKKEGRRIRLECPC